MNRVKSLRSGGGVGHFASSLNDPRIRRSLLVNLLFIVLSPPLLLSPLFLSPRPSLSVPPPHLNLRGWYSLELVLKRIDRSQVREFSE